MKKASDLNIKIFADGAEKSGMLEMYKNPIISGFTTNPTLMYKAGIRDYKAFAHEIIQAIPDKSISFEVFADDFGEMERQALEIHSWGKNVYVKIPVTNTKSDPCYDLIRRLSNQGVQLNVTAIFTLEQVREVTYALEKGPPSIISVFAGRIADTGMDPVPLMQAALEIMKLAPQAELLWASPRELINIFQAEAIGCHILTATNSLIEKLDLVGKDLSEYSLETVQMFYKDASSAGFQL
ncbi:MAG: transaldolase [SAR324 cluster bacterium]|nr:transaldolase [SAR324 cluster bacterium]